MSKSFLLFCCSMFAVSALMAASHEPRWIESDGLSCNATCGNLFPLSPGRNAEGSRYFVCAARVEGDKAGLRPGYSIRAKPNTCMVVDGDGVKSVEDFSCYCVDTEFGTGGQ